MKNLIGSERRRNNLSMLLLAGLLVLGLVCGILDYLLEKWKDVETVAHGILEEVQLPDGAGQIDDISLIEDRSIYDADDPDSVVCFYVTVRYGSEARGTNHTFSEVNNVVRFVDGAHANIEVYADALVQVGDENGPTEGSLGFGETKSNATIRVRGNTSTASAAKSYKLSINDNAGAWRGQTNIALNKHAYDPTRFRNKLFFDVLKEIPEVPSIRTQFVHLYIKDETSGKTEFEDYGLFTQAEVPTKKYLKNHGLDSGGYLYKVISFNWESNAAIKNIDDPTYDFDAMEAVISARGREDNQKLIELVTAVNDMSIDTNYLIDTYFDRENLNAWLAYNILMGNIDTVMQNYYLYSPLNGNKWYFILWDGDASLRRTQNEMKYSSTRYADWQYGISNYWNVQLFQRYLKYATNREQIKEKVEEIYSWLNREYIDRKAQEYNRTVEEYVMQTPDYLHLYYTKEERDYIVDNLGAEIDTNYRMFLDSLEALMPLWIYEPEEAEGQVKFSWQEAYDFSAQNITYSLKVSRYPDMREPVVEESHLDALTYTMDKVLLGSGEYYIEVKATSSDGRVASACNTVSVNEEMYLGIMGVVLE